MSAGRFQTSTSKDGSVVVYDLAEGKVVHEITDYSIFLVDKLQRKALTVHTAGWRLTRFWSYLCDAGKSVADINDRLLVKYRDRELELVCLDRSHRGSMRAARRSVNEKLAAILGWLVWQQATGATQHDSIGPSNCRVTADQHGLRRSFETALRPGLSISSPLYFRDAGDGGTGPYVDDETFDSAHKHAVGHATSAFLANRNALFLDIARATGFRRGSICSLSVQQFQREELEKWNEDTFPVTPDVQKRDYENTFEVPIELALRVLHFIEHHRSDLVRTLSVGVKVTKGKIFLSQTTGRPLEGRSMARALQASMRFAGASKGKVVHAVRGLFASEAVEDEAEMRRTNGLDTSTLSIAQATAWKLGQKRAESLVPYVAHSQSRAARKRMAKAKRGPADDGGSR